MDCGRRPNLPKICAQSDPPPSENADFDRFRFVCLDISAAFDTIDHSVFISRPENDFGVDCVAASWLLSYLPDRQQYVKLGRHTSSTSPCLYGVPVSYTHLTLPTILRV